MTSPAQALQAEAHRLADVLSGRIAGASRGPVWADVTTVTAGGARGGVAALVKVTRLGTEVIATGGYPNSYTPQVGDRVLVQYVDNQLVILMHPVGQP